LTKCDVTDEPFGTADFIHLACRIFGALAATANHAEIGQSLPQHLNGLSPRELRTLPVTMRATQHYGHVGVRVRYDARVLHVTGAQLHYAAAPGADRCFAQGDFAAADQAAIEPINGAMDVPNHQAKASARCDVGGDTEPDRGDGQGNDDFHALALAVPQTFAVAPRRELHARRLTDAHEVVALPPDQRDLRGRRGHAAQACRVSDGFNALQAIIEWREIPAAATRAHDPQPALPLVKRNATAHTKTGWTAVAVERRVAESTSMKHDATMPKSVRK